MLERRRLPGDLSLFIDAGNELAERFVDDRRVALVSFTGSTRGRPQGRRARRRSAGQSLLELGGNNAIIVDETADLELAIPAIVFGAVGTAGQRCTTHAPPVRAPIALATSSTQRLRHAYEQVRIGDPLEPAR